MLVWKPLGFFLFSFNLGPLNDIRPASWINILYRNVTVTIDVYLRVPKGNANIIDRALCKIGKFQKEGGKQLNC